MVSVDMVRCAQCRTLRLRSHLDAGRPRRRLGLHRPADNRKRHCPNGNHRHAGRREDEWTGPPLGLARVRDRLRQVRDDFLRRGEFVRDGFLRVLELSFLGEPALLEALRRLLAAEAHPASSVPTLPRVTSTGPTAV